jgi:hypothetical protein
LIYVIDIRLLSPVPKSDLCISVRHRPLPALIQLLASMQES